MPFVDRLELEEFCAAARRGAESLRRRKDSAFHGFPNGQCGATSEILGHLLKERLSIDAWYVCRWRYDKSKSMQTHAWLEVGDVLIDLTHDQFPRSELSGWIFPIDNAWHHKRFPHLQTRSPAHELRPGLPVDAYEAMRGELSAWPAMGKQTAAL